jgi:MFS family permease
LTPSNRKGTESTRASLTQLSRSVWALGFVSMFMDASSELVHSLLPVFMSSILGASMLTIGLVEGVAEATASITKLFSGFVSDSWGKRKPLVVIGYGLSAVTKTAFPLASSIALVAAARFADRVGKGIRGAPRDALIADVTPAKLRGAAYGLRQALDSVGAVVGPLSAIAFMVLLRGNVKGVLWVAVVPAAVAVLLLVTRVREPEQALATTAARTPIRFTDAASLSADYWLTVALGSMFTLARFSEAFLILRAQRAGLSATHVPIVLVVMNIAYTVGAYPAGVASDRWRPSTLLLAGMGVLIVADVMLATAPTIALVLAGAGLWGLHMALTQGLFSKLVADTASAPLRGTAFGVFNLATGISTLLASVIAGALWNTLGPGATFWVGAAFAGVTASGVLHFSGLTMKSLK